METLLASATSAPPTQARSVPLTQARLAPPHRAIPDGRMVYLAPRNYASARRRQPSTRPNRTRPATQSAASTPPGANGAIVRSQASINSGAHRPRHTQHLGRTARPSPQATRAITTPQPRSQQLPARPADPIASPHTRPQPPETQTRSSARPIIGPHERHSPARPGRRRSDATAHSSCPVISKGGRAA